MGFEVIGAVISAFGSLIQASSRSDAAEYNAKMAERNAAIARQQAAQDAEEQHRKSARQIGQMRAGYGASGIVGNEGSALDVLAQSAADAEMDRLNILYRGNIRAYGYDSDAELGHMRAENEMTSGMFGAGKSVILGLGNAQSSPGSGNTMPSSVQYYDDWNWGSG